MQISIDGGQTWVESDGVRVRYEIEPPWGFEGEEGKTVHLEVNCASEGVIMDVIDAGFVLGSSSQMADEIVESLVEDTAADVKSGFDQDQGVALQMGFEVRPDPDQPGRFYFKDPHGNYSDISFDSPREAWERVIAEMDSHEEVAKHNKHTAADPDKALAVARALVDAYRRGEESGSVDWEDLDQVHALALEVLGGDAEQTIAPNRGQEMTP